MELRRGREQALNRIQGYHQIIDNCQEEVNYCEEKVNEHRQRITNCDIQITRLRQESRDLRRAVDDLKNQADSLCIHGNNERKSSSLKEKDKVKWNDLLEQAKAKQYKCIKKMKQLKISTET